MLPLFALVFLAPICGGGGSPQGALNRFVAAVNDADFNDAYESLSDGCQLDLTLTEFQESYGKALLAMGIGRGGAFGGTSLKAEDVVVDRTGNREAEIYVDWVLRTSIDSPLPLFGTIADERVPLETVLKVAGTPERPLYVVDGSGSGDWRLEDCDPLGLQRLHDEQQALYEELEAYYQQSGY